MLTSDDLASSVSDITHKYHFQSSFMLQWHPCVIDGIKLQSVIFIENMTLSTVDWKSRTH